MTHTPHDVPSPPEDITSAFTSALLDTGLTHLPIDALRRLWSQADPAWQEERAARGRLAETLTGLAATGAVELPPRPGQQWDNGDPSLPRRITVPANRRPHTAALDPASEPWCPDMRWAARWIRDTRPPGRLRQDAARINRWLLATTGRPRPVVAREERSLHIFDDEKRLTALTTGSLFTPGRLTLDRLACESPTGALRVAVVHHRGPVLVVENRATYDSAWKALRQADASGYAAVVFGGGDAAPALIADLVRLHDMNRVSAERFDYAGDVDIAGVEAAAHFIDAARAANLTADPAHRIWRAVARARPTGEDLTGGPAQAAAAIATAQRLGLPAEVQDRLAEGLRVPQERIDRQALTDTSWWAPAT